MLIAAGMAVTLLNDRLSWLVWPLAGLGFAATVVLGRGFDRALRAQLRAGL